MAFRFHFPPLIHSTFYSWIIHIFRNCLRQHNKFPKNKCRETVCYHNNIPRRVFLVLSNTNTQPKHQGWISSLPKGSLVNSGYSFGWLVLPASARTRLEMSMGDEWDAEPTLCRIRTKEHDLKMQLGPCLVSRAIKVVISFESIGRGMFDFFDLISGWDDVGLEFRKMDVPGPQHGGQTLRKTRKSYTSGVFDVWKIESAIH